MSREKSLESILAISAGLLLLFATTQNKIYLFTCFAVMAIGLFVPALTLWIAKAWMKLAELLGAVMSKVILSLVFFLILTPIALLQKISGSSGITIKKPKSNSMFTTRSGVAYQPGDLKNPW